KKGPPKKGGHFFKQAELYSALLAVFLAAVFLAAVFLAAAFFTAVFLAAALVAVFLAAVLRPGFSGRGSNSKPILPSAWRTRKALNLRLVREDTKPSSKSVLPSPSNLAICSRVISCCKITLPLRKSQLLEGPTDFSHR